ncbi:MAG: geranylgeranylglycerol-phosphate geranylgeranyltransferase [Methanomicrobiales archaeon]|nr:geranylgeranylglycerol-phosphate geranylgeranyltransferase [Methanomicrobiales archaeon]MDI6876385.1 geranylgeranylglycerol-phosphate geranylgeranyltransferase [Methanomicrobiales archaeon]
MHAGAFFRITRPLNSAVAGLATSLGFIVATGTLQADLLLLIAIVALITAAGNVVNDCCDAAIDAINRPDRPIPAGEIGTAQAAGFSALLFTSGIALALFTNPLCIGIALLNSLLLVIYAVYLKKAPLVGNIAVSYLSASIFLFGGALAGVGGALMALPVAGITFLAMIARELLKDAEDVDGDRAGGAVTVPMLIGIRRTAILALGLLAVAVAISLLPVGRGWGLPYLGAIGMMDGILLVAAGRVVRCRTPECIRTSGATAMLKFGMFGALTVFVVSAILAA